MLVDEILEPIVDADQIFALEDYKEDLVRTMLSETENGQDPVMYYSDYFSDTLCAVGDLIRSLPLLDKKRGAARQKLVGRMLDALSCVLDMALLFGHGFDVPLPDEDMLEFHMESQDIEFKVSPTLSAMSLTDPLNSLSYDFFMDRNSSNIDAEDCEFRIGIMISSVATIAISMECTLYDVMGMT